MTETDLTLDPLADLIRDAGRPVHLNRLSRRALRSRLETRAKERHYAPGAHYEPGERIRFREQWTTVTAVQAAANPAQGEFSVLTLTLPDGSEYRLAANVPGAPGEKHSAVTQQEVDRLAEETGDEARRALRAALESDPRFVSCSTPQGELWCLAEMVPTVILEELQLAEDVLPVQLVDGELISRTTRELTAAIWGLEDDGTDDYALYAFALRRVLDDHHDIVNLGDSWARADAWEALRNERECLSSPRQACRVELPDGVAPARASEVADEESLSSPAEEQPEPETSDAQDLEVWRRDHPDHAIFTLRARHYHEGWLPFGKQVDRLFPPLGIGQQLVTFHHHFGEDPESFPAYVDRDQGRILLSPQMYETFRHHRIYPGARLRLSVRNEQEFDLATRPTDKKEPIRVWRMWLNEDGEVEYEDFEEPRRYDIDDDVYVADVRFEDQEALFRQAEETGNSIFGLMYKKAVQWWEENDRGSLVVTSDQLHEAIHFDERARMVSKATIQWELWRRLAFKPLGGGTYLFRPQFGEEVRSALLGAGAEPAESEPVPEAPAYFIFQQRPDSEYDDRLGEVYNWRRGIPGSLQIVEGARFIYYRPGEQVFFGAGRVASIDTYVGGDGETYYDGHIADFELWAPPLSLSPQLAKRITFIEPERLGVGQAGIRKIDRRDFLAIRRAYTQQRENRQDPALTTDDSDELWKHLAGLEGQTLHTLAHKKPFRIEGVSDQALMIDPQGGAPRTLARENLEGAFTHLMAEAQISQSAIQDYSEFNSSYAAAILATLPEVDHQTDPVRLRYSPEVKEVPTPSARVLERTRSGQFVATDLVSPGPLFEGPLAEREVLEATGEPESHCEQPGDRDVQARIDAECREIRDIIEHSLAGATIYTLAQRKPNRIAAHDAKGLTVVTESGQAQVRWEWVEDVYAALVHLGEIEPKDVQEGEFRTPGGYRNAFIFPLLARFDHVEARTKPRNTLIYHQPEGPIRLGDAADDDDPSEPPPNSPDSPAPGSPPPTKARKPVLPSTKADTMQTKSLFSQHYLQNRLPDHPEWKEDPGAAFEAVQALWQRAREYGDTWNESQTEQEFIQPMLELLGWAYIVQPKASHAGRVRRPDYALLPDEEAKDEAMPHQGDDAAFYSRVSAIAEAKYWGRPLSQKDTGGREKWDAQTNPSHQMVSYLVGTRVGWGILTNGPNWRLYSREVSSTASEYYEIDLASIFASVPGDGESTEEEALVVMEQFRRWWLFFRRHSFVLDAEGRSFVERVHEGSETYARRISDTLKKLVYEEVMPEIAGGFVAYRYHEGGVEGETDESLRDIYRASLSLLYKLLFLLYGEARALLPVDHPSYREQSVTALAQWAAEQIDKGLAISDATHATGRYDSLQALFRRIDQGDPSLGIPRYDGGLFDPSSPENQFLETHKLSDRAVARAIDTLVRDAGEPVDYAYIGVQNLGSIYEGLLENRLHVVDAAAGQVELISDQGDRKATGSYYTPDYIVEYIVQNTLDPILEERDEAFQVAMDRSAELRGQLQRVADAATVRRLRNELDGAERDAREAFLGIKVLDPAMGSGHFLVNAVDHLTDAVIRRMQVYHDEHPKVPWEWNPIQRLIEHLRTAILGEMQGQGIQLDPSRLDDTALLTRLVMKRCIYGVDLNRMAVELAKLSLWLHTFTVGAPLSFLDHHLRWGNSLIGTDVRTVEDQVRKTGAGQLSLWQGPFAGLLDLTGLMAEVVERTDATLADVQKSAEIFKQFRRELTPYKQVLDLWVSQYFGNELAEEFLTVHGADVLPTLKGKQRVPAKYEATIAEARALYEEKRFFHWDLEFPEVFVDLRGRDWAESPGFEAVIGNPPWVNLFGMAASDRQYFREVFHSPYGKYDIYVVFVEASLALTNRMFGMIVPNRFLRSRYGKPLRDHMLALEAEWRVAEFSSNDVFQDATTYPCIVLGGLSMGSRLVQAAEVDTRRPTLDDLSHAEYSSVPAEHFSAGVVHRAKAIDVTQMESDITFALAAIVDQIGQGVYTGAKDIFVIEDPSGIEPEMWRPVVDGGELERFAPPRPSKYLIYPYSVSKAEIELLELEHYPRASEYLSRFESRLLGRRFWGETIASADRRFYEIWNPSPFMFSQKILYAEIASEPTFTVDLNGDLACLKTCYCIVLRRNERHSLCYLLSLLNSSLLFYALRQLAPTMRGGKHYRFLTQYVEQLPIRRIGLATPRADRERLLAASIAQATEWIEATEAGLVESVSFSAFSGSDFGRWLDERLSPVHTPDPQLVRQHNADPLNEDWQLAEEGPAEQSDVVHDLLAHLAEQMIEMHKEKQSRLQTFWLDLEGVTEPSVYDTLRNRGKWESSLWKAEPCREFVDEESRSTVHLDESLGWNETCFKAFIKMLVGNVSSLSEVVGVYRKHHRDYRQLVRRIAATDRLIDLIVYRLYGLTAEEVAVVEGKSP